MKIERRSFGTTPDGDTVDLFTLTNSAGYVVQMTNYGAMLIRLEVPDRLGQLANVNLGFDNLDDYLSGHPYLGSTVGRFCNRIANGCFVLDGKTYELAVNNGPNHLHGGLVGFDKLVWQAKELQSKDRVGVCFSVLSPAGQEGYPGNLQVEAEYTWNEASEWSYRLRATTDAATVLNLTNHAYWNLAGANHGSILEHRLQIKCGRYLNVDETLIPTGEMLAVAGTPLDFRNPREIGEQIASLPATKGYDHCYVTDASPGQLASCAMVHDPGSGRVMEVLTTQPGVQLYTGNQLDGAFKSHGALCLETQHFPDSPNRPEFPSTRLDPGQTFEQITVHRFSVA